MEVQRLVEIIRADFYTGVPDSQLKALCNFLLDKYGTDSRHHIIGANEGNCTAIAAGYHLATGKIPVVYMQNSGEGNAINPIASLTDKQVYGIPIVFIIGWRGEPGVYDEPQHIKQGMVTLKILKDMGIDYAIITEDTLEDEIVEKMKKFEKNIRSGKSVAFVVKKNAISYNAKTVYENTCTLVREKVLEHIVKAAGEAPVISTTGKTSRELFEIRERNGQGHQYDFLTVGSMGHSSSIALGIALQKPEIKVWCVDGDGAVIMHMGALAIIGACNPGNLVHIVINNMAHESVGGMPTVAGSIDFVSLAKACGYEYVTTVADMDSLDRELNRIKKKQGLCMIEVRCAIGSRSDLGRPTVTPGENKVKFMEYLK